MCHENLLKQVTMKKGGMNIKFPYRPILTQCQGKSHTNSSVFNLESSMESKSISKKIPKLE